MKRLLVMIDHYRFDIVAVLAICGIGYAAAHFLVSLIGALVMR